MLCRSGDDGIPTCLGVSSSSSSSSLASLSYVRTGPDIDGERAMHELFLLKLRALNSWVRLDVTLERLASSRKEASQESKLKPYSDYHSLATRVFTG